MKNILNETEKYIDGFLADISKVKEKRHGWKAAAARMRKKSLEIERIMKTFRKVSVSEEKKS